MLPRDEPLALQAIWHVYVIECEDGSFYTGVTTDVDRRYQAHALGKGARYTRAHPPRRLLASYPAGSRAAALRAEFQIKHQPKAKKLATLRALAAMASGTCAGG